MCSILLRLIGKQEGLLRPGRAPFAEPSIRRDRFGFPAPQFVIVVPELHRLAGAPALGNADGLSILVREEFAAMLNVTAEAVHKV